MMKTGPGIARIGALVGDPARAGMLTALIGGIALTAGELAREAGVTPQTASHHLEKLRDGGLVVGIRQGRHFYFELANAEVGSLLEGLMGLATSIGHQRLRPGPKEPALRQARVCYDHLAGDLAVAMLDSMTAQGMIVGDGDALDLTACGAGLAERLGIDLALLKKRRRPLCRGCLDWSVRRPHLAGGLGASLLSRFFALGWASRVEGTRIVRFTADSRTSFDHLFGIDHAKAAKGERTG